MKKTFTISILLMCCFSGAQNLLNGLRACYPLDGNAQNAAFTGPALNGTLVGAAPVAGHPGSSGTAYSIQGHSGSYIELPDDPALKSDSVFFSGWFRPDSLPYVQYLVYTYNGCSIDFEAYSLTTHYEAGAGGFVFCLTKAPGSCSGKPQIVSTTTIVPGNWYHVCFYIDGSVMKLFVNGSLESFTNHSVSFAYQNGLSVFLGVTNQAFFENPFKGAIDNVRFYNRELTTQEINLLYSLDPACTSDGLIPVSSFSVSRNLACTGENVSFTDKSTNNPTTWNWQFQGASPGTSTLQHPSVVYPAAGVYTVSLVAANGTGSGSQSVMTVSVNACAVLPDGDNHHPDVRIYPNPATDRIFVENAGDRRIVVTDLLGKPLSYTIDRFSDNRLELRFTEEISGVYLLGISDKNGTYRHVMKLCLAR